MDRARRAASAAILLVLALGLTAGMAPRNLSGGVVAAVSWPVSSLLISEVQTGGASASDEFVELSNTGVGPVDLAGLEVVYVTATGGTITRKATWSQALLLEPGRHLLLANTLGVHAPLADGTYSGGLAATGGSIVLRPIGGSPIDAVGWGDASSSFVEGAAAPAPPAGSSIERRPGGLEGNTQDSNENAADWFIQSQPNPQNLAAPPVPAPLPSASPEPSGTPGPSASPAPTAEPEPSTPPPTVEPSPTAVVSPSPEPSGSPDSSAVPSPSASADPSPSGSPLPSNSPVPTPSPDPNPSPSGSPAPSSSPSGQVIPIAEARLLLDGSSATIAGVLTVPLGLLEDGRAAFVEDASGGIAVYLDQSPAAAWPAGTLVRLNGTLDERYAVRTLRAALADVEPLGSAELPGPIGAGTGAIGEALEARRVQVSGRTSGSPTTYADGLGLLVDDGSGPVRVIVAPEALGQAEVPSGTLVTVTGPVGQRDSSGTGSTGYRIHATLAGDLVLNPEPSPTPSASPSPTPSETTAPSPSPSPSPSPTPRLLMPIGEARLRAVGSTVDVSGVVTAEAGRLGTPALIVIEDASGAIVVRLADGTSPPARGSWLEVRGQLADPYGQLEVRPALGDVHALGTGIGPTPITVRRADLGEGTEARLVVLEGTVIATPSRSSSNDIALDVTDTDGDRVRVMADASSGVVPSMLRAGQSYWLTGIVGQRASRKGVLDGYRLWLRDARDIVEIPLSGASLPGSLTVQPLGTIAALEDQEVVVQGRVTVHATLLDSTGRRTVIEDGTGAIEVLLPLGSVVPAMDTWIRVRGTVGRAYDAPRLRAVELTQLQAGVQVAPVGLHAQPGLSLEWRLAVATGVVTQVTRLGTRWRAELDIGPTRILVDGLPGSVIPSTAIVTGQRLTVIGIVRRPYPGATDRRFSLVPRNTSDLRVSSVMVSPPGSPGGAPESQPSGGSGAPGGTPARQTAQPEEMDLATIHEHPGAWVRVGGLVVIASGLRLVLDDGTALAPVRLDGDAASYAGLVIPGDAVNAVGIVVSDPDEGWEILVTAPNDLVRVGALGQPTAIGAGSGLSRAGVGGPEDGLAGQRGDPHGPILDSAATTEDPLRVSGWALGLVLLVALARVLRRSWLRRRLARRVARRLAGLAHAQRETA